MQYRLMMNRCGAVSNIGTFGTRNDAFQARLGAIALAESLMLAVSVDVEQVVTIDGREIPRAVIDLIRWVKSQQTGAAVTCIKALRTIYDCSLKEAKDAYDAM